MSEGDLTAENSKQWADGCQDYFENKDIAANKQVRKVLGSLKDPRICEWANTDRSRVQALTFEKFMDELRAEFLDEDWEGKTRAEVLAVCQNGHPFRDFFRLLNAKNALLANTPSHFDDAKMQHQLEAGMDKVLTERGNLLKANKIADFKLWIAEMKRVDKLMVAERVQTRAELNEMMKKDRDNGRRNNVLTEPSRRANNASLNSTSAAPSFSLKLTDKEKSLLRDNEGCFKCRRFYTDHQSKDCKSDFPSGLNYKECTQSDANADKKSRQNKKPTNKTVAAVMSSSSRGGGRLSSRSSFRSPSPRHGCSVSLHRSRSTSPRRTTMSPIRREGSYPHSCNSCSRSHSQSPMHPMTAAILGSSANPVGYCAPNGSNVLEGDSSDSNVSAVLFNTVAVVSAREEPKAPLKVPHLFWDAVSVPEGETDVVEIHALLDHGSHLVLIRPEIADSLNLKCHVMPCPKTIQVAVQSEPAESIVLNEYVQLRLSDPSFCWTSQVVRAVIAPHLSVAVLLGLPFLAHNHIVIDHELRTAVDKSSKFDLLHPTPRADSTKCKLPKEKREVTVKDHKRLIKELKSLAIRRQGEHVKLFNTVAAIRTRIECLAAQEELSKLGDKVRVDFKEVFEAIPHLDDLPDDVYCCIKLKDANKTITTRSYSTPRKYRDAWSQLIKQHLDAGQIRPSSLAHMSPAFLIPKSNPNELPRWVNDYRSLNANTVIDAHPLPRIDDILADAAKGKIWSKLDMTNSFFQT